MNAHDSQENHQRTTLATETAGRTSRQVPTGPLKAAS